MDGASCIQQAYEAIFRGDYEAAGIWFERAVEAEPSNASYYYRGSITLARSGKLTMALAYATRAVELAPEEPAYAEQLNMLEARKKIAEAQELLSRSPAQAAPSVPLLREAFRLDPLAADARLLLGIAYRLLGEYDKAIESLQEALALNPQYDEARKLLSEIQTGRRRKHRQP